MFDVLQYTMDKKFELGEEQGFAIGRNEGISQMQTVLANLYAQGRESDIKRALTDSEYLAELLATNKD